MIRQTLAALLCFMAIAPGYAQYRWHAGTQAFPSLYWYRNATDEKYFVFEGDFGKIYFPDNLKPNAFAGGLALRFEEKDAPWYLSAALMQSNSFTYSSYAKDFIVKGSGVFQFNWMQYLRLSSGLGIRYFTNERKSYLYAELGPCISFLTGYQEVAMNYREITNTEDVYLSGIWRLENNRVGYRHWDAEGNITLQDNYPADWRYRRWVFGSYAEAGHLFSINKKWSVKAGLRIESDVSGVDNMNAKLYYSQQAEPLSSWNHNLRQHNRSNYPGEIPRRSHSFNVWFGVLAAVYYRW